MRNRSRLCFWHALVLALITAGSHARAQDVTPRRQFVTVSYDWLYTWPLHFDKFPLEDIVGAPLDDTQPPYDYRTQDGRTFVDVEQFRRRNRAVSVAVYPFGLSTGATLGIRGSIEQLPDIRVRFDGASPIASYSLANAVAYDIAAGVYVADRSAGWGLGAYSFLTGGIGRVTSDERSGRRYFAGRRWWTTIGAIRLRAVGQVRLEPIHRADRASLLHRPDQHARDGELLNQNLKPEP